MQRSNASCALMISRSNCSRMSASLLIICTWIAPRDLMERKLASSSKAPSALRSLRKLVSMSSRCDVRGRGARGHGGVGVEG